MTSRKVTALRGEADQLCDEAWPLYSRAGRLRDEAYLLDEAEFDRWVSRKAREALGAEVEEL